MFPRIAGAILGLLSIAAPAGVSSHLVSESGPTLVFRQFGGDRPIRMVAYGDMRFTDPRKTFGTNPKVRKWLAERIAEERPQALLLTGDMPYTGADADDWAVFQSETKPWRDENILQLPTIGNHEIKGGREKGVANYLANFPSIANHRYYSALLGNVEVISLDLSQATAPASPQARWFAAQLNHVPAGVDFLFILFHIPWVADRQSQIFAGLPNPETISLRSMLEARLSKIHARVVVFSGHIHNYERFLRRDVVYIISGGGGAEPYPVLFRGSDDLYRDLGFPVYHYLTLEIANHQLHAVMWKVKDPEAATLSVEKKDEFTLTANK